jgi:two-component system, chemotaxis family, chemotaxis protein CheY
VDDVPHTILIVDDDPDMRNLLRMHLSSAGYKVVVAEDAVEAGRAILVGVPSLMIVDVNMPYMDGLELIDAIVKDTTLRPFPIVVLTSEEEAHDATRKLGAQFLRKPIPADKLLGVVQRAIKDWSGT